MNMADNKTIRAGKPNCINTDKRILQNFEKFMPLTKQEEYKDRVIQISGIIDTNAHAFPLSINGNSTTVCNLYSQTSLMAHSCLPNCSWSPDKSLSSLTLTIRSNLKISQGSILSVAYDDSQLLVCTLKRLVPNEINGMFICHCERCVDPTELGSYIGALKCPGCATGYLLPIDPLDSFSSWKCDNGNKAGEEGESGNCNQVLDDESIMEMLEEAEQICGYTKLSLGLGSAANSPEDEIGCLELLKEFDKEYGLQLVHPNHYILQEVNVRILKGDYRQGLGALQDWDLRLYLERCERLLGIANVLTPGFCEYQAFLQFHFCQGLLCLERRKEGLQEEDDDVENDDDHENDADRHCVKKDDDENGDDGNLGANKLKHQKGNKMSDDGGGTKLRNGNQVEIVGSRKNNAREEEENAGNLFWGKYSDSKENCKRLLEMLSFLVDFFQELNPDHRMLLPIKETIQDTETKLEKQ